MRDRFPLRFSAAERQALYEVIFARRDVRCEFLPDPVAPEQLWRVLDAAHHAGSVGFSQPWSFLVISDRERRARVRDVFLRETERAAERFPEEKAALYRRIKLEGILEAPINLCVTCDRERHGPEVIGRNTMRQTDIYSTCCAIQNLWLAARAEGLGVGWVSIIDPEEVKRIAGIPANQELVAYLCLGHVREFAEKPDLEKVGWLQRLPLSQVTFWEHWGERRSEPSGKFDHDAESTDGSVSSDVIEGRSAVESKAHNGQPGKGKAG